MRGLLRLLGALHRLAVRGFQRPDLMLLVGGPASDGEEEAYAGGALNTRSGARGGKMSELDFLAAVVLFLIRSHTPPLNFSAYGHTMAARM
jgi:hypothetical protein